MHDIDYSDVAPDPTLAVLLGGLTVPAWIFTARLYILPPPYIYRILLGIDVIFTLYTFGYLRRYDVDAKSYSVYVYVRWWKYV